MSDTLTFILSAQVSQIALPDLVQTCSPEALIHNVVGKMRDSKIGSIVIVENEKPVGIFTERDYLMKIACLGVNVRNAKIKTYMTPSPVTVSDSETVQKVLLTMRLGHFRHVIVTHPTGEVKGIISIKDVMDFLLDSLTQDRSQAA